MEHNNKLPLRLEKWYKSQRGFHYREWAKKELGEWYEKEMLKALHYKFFRDNL